MADATNANDELYPIAVLIDELKVRQTGDRDARRRAAPLPSMCCSDLI